MIMEYAKYGAQNENAHCGVSQKFENSRENYELKPFKCELWFRLLIAVWTIKIQHNHRDCTNKIVFLFLVLVRLLSS